MEIIPIFTDPDECNLWAVRYEGETEDVFNKTFHNWYDNEFLVSFFKENKALLSNKFWGGISIDKAINIVYDEAELLDTELYRIDTAKQGSLKDIFQPLHDNKFTYTWVNEQHRKGKAYKEQYPKPFLRLYAIELDDGTMVVTGGSIKLTDVMYDEEKDALKRVQDFLKSQGITDRLGLVQSL